MANKGHRQNPKHASDGNAPRRFISLRQRDPKEPTSYDKEQDARATRIANSAGKASWVAACATIIIAAATIMNIIVAYLQWKEIRATLGPAQKSAAAAADQAEVAKKSFAGLERPYLFIENIKYTALNYQPVVEFSVTNYGRSPARLVWATCAWNFPRPRGHAASGHNTY